MRRSSCPMRAADPTPCATSSPWPNTNGGDDGGQIQNRLPDRRRDAVRPHQQIPALGEPARRGSGRAPRARAQARPPTEARAQAQTRSTAQRLCDQPGGGRQRRHHGRAGRRRAASLQRTPARNPRGWVRQDRPRLKDQAIAGAWHCRPPLAGLLCEGQDAVTRALVVTGPFEDWELELFAKLLRDIERSKPDHTFAMVVDDAEGEGIDEALKLVERIFPKRKGVAQ